MNELEIIAGNELIAKFMGLKENKYGSFLIGGALTQFDRSNHREWCGTESIEMDWTDPDMIELYKETGGFYWEISPNNLAYYSSWDWLMPVVEKIESLGFWIRMDYGDVFIVDDNSTIVIENPTHEDGYTKLSLVYSVVVSFITRYNTLGDA